MGRIIVTEGQRAICPLVMELVGDTSDIPATYLLYFLDDHQARTIRKPYAGLKDSPRRRQ